MVGSGHVLGQLGFALVMALSLLGSPVVRIARLCGLALVPFALAAGLIAQRTAYLEGVAYAAWLLLLAVVCWGLGRSVFASGDISAHRIRGAVALYLLIALAFAAGFRLIDVASSVPALLSNTEGAPLGTGDFPSYLYFSLVTITTLGYGDITPQAELARSLATLEAVAGQFYIAVLVARLVALRLLR